MQEWGGLTPEPTDGVVVVAGERVVLDGLHCTCLLSPRCAHVAAVCLALGHAPEPALEPAAAPEAATEAATPEVPTTGAVTDTALLEAVLQRMTTVVRHGLYGLPLKDVTALSAILQRARLHRLERYLTGVVTAVSELREGRPVNRADVTNAVAGVLMTTHLLMRNPGDPAAVGTARRVYHDLGSATLTPVGACPVITSSGFAGASVVLAGQVGGISRVLTLGRTPPGGADRVAQVWNSPVGLGDLRGSLSELSRNKVYIGSGTATEDGRLGSGKGVRAALGRPVTAPDAAACADGKDVECRRGPVQDVGRRGVTVDGGEFAFSTVSRVCGVDGLIGRLHQAQLSGAEVQVVARNSEVVAVWLDDAVHYPGLDDPEDNMSAGRAGPLRDVDVVPPLVDSREATPAHRVREWLENVVFSGTSVLRPGGGAVQLDAAWCGRNGAPLAAKLLRELGDSQGKDPRAILRIIAYGDRGVAAP